MAWAQQLSLEMLSRALTDAARVMPDLDYTPVMKAFAITLEASAKENFVNQSDPDGQPWAKLKASTIARRKRRRRHRSGNVGTGMKILNEDGLLMASESARGAGAIRDISKARLIYGSNLEKAGLHQEGYPQTDGSWVPARPHIGLNTDNVTTMVNIAEEFVVDQFMAMLRRP